MRISILTLIACLVISPLQMTAQSLEEFVHTMDSLSMEPPQIQSEFDAKYLVAVDVAAPKMILDPPEARPHIDLCIDHHGTNVGYAAATCVDGDCAAAAMVVQRIIRLLYG